MRNKKLYIILLVVVIIGLAISGWIGVFVYKKPNQNYQLIIYKNSSLVSIANNLSAHDVIINRWLFIASAKLLKKERVISPGVYVLPENFSIWQLLNFINLKNSQLDPLVIKSGQTYNQVLENLSNTQYILHDVSNGVLESSNTKINPEEGMVFPNSYSWVPGESETAILTRAKTHMQKYLDNLWRTNYPKISEFKVFKSPYDLLIFASLVEKEAQNYADMQKVAQVFINRINKNMPLQTDPAVFYGLNQTIITKKDFKKKTPYNTYLNTGLPPTPICIPSIMAIQASLNPQGGPKLLYFIADKTGKMYFTEKFTQHIANIRSHLGN